MAIHSSILAGKIPWTEEPDRSMGSQRVGPDWATSLSLSLCLPKLGSQFLSDKDYIHYICWIIKKAKEFQKNIYFCIIGYAKAFDCVDHKKNCGKFLKRWEYQTTWPASWEICMQVKKQQSEHGTTDWFQIRKGVYQGCILSPCLFNLCAEYIMRNAGLDEAQARI